MNLLDEVELRVKKELVLLSEEWDRRDASNYSNNDEIIKTMVTKNQTLKAIKLIREAIHG